MHVHAGIVTPPQSANVSLNEVAVFNCTAITTFINWEVNGQFVDDQTRRKGFDDTASLVTLDAAKNLRMRVLRVLGSPDSNDSNITCVAIRLGLNTLRSEPALILVQGIIHSNNSLCDTPICRLINNYYLWLSTGLLGAVHSLTVKPINSTTVLISWSPPFTLEGVPILGYNVTITNTTSGENETVSVKDTTLLYSIDPGSSYTVTVVALNMVGGGQHPPSKSLLVPNESGS